MPNKCSAPGCKGNYSSTDGYVTVFKLPLEQELRSKWINALHLENIHANTFVCEKHFRNEDISRTYSVPSGPNASLQEFPRKLPILHKDAVPCFLPSCPKYLSAPEGSKQPKRFKFEEKEEMFFMQVIQESRQSFKAEEDKYRISTFDELKLKLFNESTMLA